MKVDEATGEVLWSTHIASSGEHHESTHDLAIGCDGDVYVAGRGYQEAGGEDMLVIRLDGESGDQVWDRFIRGVGDLEDRAWSIVMAADGHPVVTGVSNDGAGGADFLTVKLDAADGGDLWSVREPGAYLDTVDYGWLIACDDGDVIMANNFWRSGQGYNIILRRLAGTDGAEIWSAEFDGAASASDRCVDLMADAAGQPVVVGVSDGDVLTARFGADDGALLWQAAHDGPAGWYDSGRCVARGADGEILTGGYVNGGDSSWDAVMIAYDPADGTELWHRVYDGDDGLSDELRHISYADGHYYPVGYSYGAATDMDLLALHYYDDVGTAVPDVWTAGGHPVAWPNPFVEETRVTFSLDAPGTLRAEVFDLRGRRVRVLTDRSAAAGDHPVVWDGRDAEGNALAAGIYFVRGQCGDARYTTRVLRIR